MIVLLVYIAFVLVVIYWFLQSCRPTNYPPGPKGKPIVGNIPLVKELSKQCGGQYLAFQKLAQDFHTNILGLKFGSENIVVVFTYGLIRQVLTSEIFEGRPNSFFLKLRCLGKRRGITCTEGEVWSTHRNFLVRHLRNVGFGKSPMEIMIQEELDDMKLTIAKMDSKVRISRLIAPSVLSVLWGLTSGTRISRDDPKLNNLLDLFWRRARAFDMSGGTLSQFPFLRYLFPEGSGYNLIKNINTELQSFFMKIIDEHYKTWIDGRDDDVIYAFISEMKANKGEKYFTDDQLLMICLDIFIAGSETTGNTVDFAFLLMLLYPDIQAKVKKCLEEAFDETEDIRYCDRHRVPYVEAVLAETERFCSVVPISGPRRVLRTTRLGQYTIPKDTTILMSIYSIFRDPEIWGDPDVFRPERFLDSNGKYVPNEKLIGFGLGRRRCLGETLARSCIFVFFAGILRQYEVLPDSDSPMPTTTPLPGITMSPQKYTVLLKPISEDC